MKNYCIHEGYVSRTSVVPATEFNQKDQCQNEVYELAAKLFKENGFTSVLDVGTGGGYKLMKYFRDAITIGTDTVNLEFLRATYPDRDWRFAPLSEQLEGSDLLICADVIEHIEDPDELMGFIVRSKPKLVVISTPDRGFLTSVNPGKFPVNGPPYSDCHFREWNMQEFYEYIKGFLKISDHRTHNTSTQLIVGTI